MLISVIVAIYNVDLWLESALDSLQRQTYRNIEILLIDDGSTDGSGFTCDSFASKDSRVKVIHKVNGGVSTARQAGLEAMSGDYVIHCDPDDYMETDMIEKMVEKACETDADIVTCDYFRNDEYMRFEYKDGKDLLGKYIKNQLFPFCWNTMIKCSFIKQNSIKYSPLWLSHSEDGLFVARALAAGAKTVHVEKALYHYMVRPNSLSNSFSRKSYDSMVAVVEELQKLLDEKNSSNLYNRKRFVKQVAFETHRFSEVRNRFPEINDAVFWGSNSDRFSIDSLLAKSMVCPPWVVWIEFWLHKNVKSILYLLNKV